MLRQCNLTLLSISSFRFLARVLEAFILAQLPSNTLLRLEPKAPGYVREPSRVSIVFFGILNHLCIHSLHSLDPRLGRKKGLGKRFSFPFSFSPQSLSPSLIHPSFHVFRFIHFSIPLLFFVDQLLTYNKLFVLTRDVCLPIPLKLRHPFLSFRISNAMKAVV